MKKILTTLCCVTLLSAGTQAIAAPSGDEDWLGSVEVGLWNTKATLTSILEQTDSYLPATANLSGKNEFYGALNYRLSGRWSIGYKHYNIATANSNIFSGTNTDSWSVTSQGKYNGNNNELNFIYSLTKNSRLALFAGYNRIHNEFTTNGVLSSSTTATTCSGAVSNSSSGSSSSSSSYLYTDAGTRNYLQGGLLANATLNDRLTLYGQASFGGHSLFQAETGLGYKLGDTWQAKLGYRWFQVNTPFTEQAGTSPGVIYNKVKAQGPYIGITCYFGKSKPKTTPIPVKPAAPKPTTVIYRASIFDFDSADVVEQKSDQLRKVVDIATKEPKTKFHLVGHTDGIGSDEYNMDLSWQRVKTAQQYLIAKGIAESRMTIDAKGKQEPIANNDTEQGRAQNRRVDIQVIYPETTNQPSVDNNKN
ncbi:MAG: ompA family protein [Firmicutes bacterium]|nr:ompA family protein [Bacillota bacterium]